MITFNYQLQKEFKNQSSEFSVLFDTISVDVAVLKCPIVICQCIVDHMYTFCHRNRKLWCSNYVTECSSYRTASNSSGWTQTALQLAGQTDKNIVAAQKTRTVESFRCKVDVIKWVLSVCVCCSDLDVHVGYGWRISIEDIQLCSNSHNNTNVWLRQKHNNIV